MAVSHTDTFYVIDPAVPPPVGTKLVAQHFAFEDRDEDGYIGTGVGDSVDGAKVTAVWLNDTVTVRTPDAGDVKITGVTFYVDGGPALFTPTDGTDLQDAVFVGSSYVVESTKVAVDAVDPTCFVRGTMIRTNGGQRPVEAIKAGDLVPTRDHGLQPVLHVSHARFPAVGRYAPVRFRKGALGNDTDLLVSQQHRMLIEDWRAQLYFGAEEVLIAARHLVNGDTIHLRAGGVVEYFHLLFPDHQIVWAAGIPSESHFPARFLDRADADTLDEIDRMFPDLRDIAAGQTAARPVVKGSLSAVLHPYPEKRRARWLAQGPPRQSASASFRAS